MKETKLCAAVVQVTSKTRLKTVCPICGAGGNSNCKDNHIIGGYLEYIGWVHAERVTP